MVRKRKKKKTYNSQKEFEKGKSQDFVYNDMSHRIPIHRRILLLDLTLHFHMLIYFIQESGFQVRMN
jgi:hypothetical protein